MSSFLEDVSNLLKLGIGDLDRLEYIKQTLENNKMMYVSDREYLQKLVRQHLSNENISEVQTMKEKPPETNEEKSSIEDAEHSQFCGNCGKKIESKNNFCPICGFSRNQSKPNSNRDYTQQQSNYQRPPKDETLTLLLSFVLGIFGIQGIGHMYVGKIGTGVAYLIAALIVAVFAFTSLSSFGFGMIFGIAFIILYIIMFIWQVLDSRNLCREYNDYYEQHRRPPW